MSHDAGMVTAELAVLLPLLAIIMVTSVSLVLAAAAQVRCVSAAAAAARLAARGEDAAEILTELGSGDAAAGRLRLRRDGSGVVTAVVTERYVLPVLGLPTPFVLMATVSDPLEPVATMSTGGAA